MRDALLAVHVLAGTSGLVLGPAGLLARHLRSRARPIAAAYLTAVKAMVVEADAHRVMAQAAG